MGIKRLATVLIGSLALIAVPSVSYADPAEDPTPPTVTSAASAETDALLAELADTQTDSEIEAIIDSGAPRAELFDPVADEVVAAVVVAEPEFSTQAITISGPGCGTATACIVSKGFSHGFNGTGSLTGPWSVVTRVASGSNSSTFWVSPTVGHHLTPNVSRSYTTTITVTKLTRT